LVTGERKMDSIISYSFDVFIVIFIAGCAINLLEKHYIVQLCGIAFLIMITAVKALALIASYPELSRIQALSLFLPMTAGISACLASMLLGFWLFSPLRKKFRD